MGLEPGQRAEVRVAVATLWTGPDAVRPADAPALRPQPDIRAWVAGLDADQKVGPGVLSQLLLGEQVLIERVEDDWAQVVALEQPAGSLDPRGYPGWLPTAHLAPLSIVDAEEWCVVDATATVLRDSPAGDVVLSGVILGTRLPVAGPAYRGWLPVRVPGQPEPCWALLRDVQPATPVVPTAGRVLEAAARLLDVPYVWGGVSAYGIDCSGLVHLAWRRFGVRLPRDASDQAAATTAVPLGEERPGDLYFFARPGQKVHHIGFVAAEPDGARRRVLHACYTQRRVLDEPVRGERAATLVAAHRVPVTARSLTAWSNAPAV